LHPRYAGSRPYAARGPSPLAAALRRQSGEIRDSLPLSEPQHFLEAL
jgi:hypothetical protein